MNNLAARQYIFMVNTHEGMNKRDYEKCLENPTNADKKEHTQFLNLYDATLLVKFLGLHLHCETVFAANFKM